MYSRVVDTVPNERNTEIICLRDKSRARFGVRVRVSVRARVRLNYFRDSLSVFLRALPPSLHVSDVRHCMHSVYLMYR